MLDSAIIMADIGSFFGLRDSWLLGRVTSSAGELFTWAGLTDSFTAKGLVESFTTEGLVASFAPEGLAASFTTEGCWVSLVVAGVGLVVI